MPFSRNCWKWARILAMLGPGLGLGAQTLGAPTTLEYGEVVVDPSGGSLTLDPATGALTSAVGVYPTGTLATASSAILATDRAGRTATVYTTVGSFTMTSTSGSFSVSPGPFSTEYPGDTFTFPAGTGNTTLTFHVGGTLSIPSGQPAGDYNGALPIFIQDNKGANSSAVNIPIHIRLIAPIALTKNQDLDMGTVIPGGSAGTVTLNAGTGTQGVTGGVLYAATTGQPAQFAVTGAPSHSFSITLGAPTIALTGPSGSMNLSLTSSLGGSSTFNGAGTATLNLGGTLNVGANQAEGDYLGTISVTVAYP